MILSHRGRSVEVVGLVDTGATVSLVPYEIGLMLGFKPELQPLLDPIVGALGEHEVRGIKVTGWQPQYQPDNRLILVVGWVQDDSVPVIFGQMNFFMEFNVCFYRSENWFDIRHKDDRQDQAE
jgi:hypothetical protein